MTTTSPSKLACDAIVERLNDASAPFAGQAVAEYVEIPTTQLEKERHLVIEVVHEEESQLIETLGDDPTEHRIRVQLVRRCNPSDVDAVEASKLLRHQIHEWLDNWDNADRSVQVIRSNVEPDSPANKEVLREMNQFVGAVLLQVQVP